MAKEPSLEECWKGWRQSGEPKLMRLADKLAPQLSIREELDSAIKAHDSKKAIYIGKTILMRTGPKGTFLNNEYALKALDEIREYHI